MSTPPIVTRSPGQVFISYSRADKIEADKLAASLENNQVGVWYDKEIAPAVDWREEIVMELQQSSMMVILLSSTASESAEIKKELDVAVRAGVPVLTARLQDIKPQGALAYELGTGNWVNLFDDRDKRREELVGFLKKFVNTPNLRNTMGLNLKLYARGRPGFIYKTRNIFNNAWALILLFAATSALEYLFYEIYASPVSQLIEAGVAPITAFFYVLLMVTIFSPVMLFSLLREGLELNEIPLLVSSLMNCFLLLVFVRNIIYWCIRKFQVLKAQRS